MKFQSDSSPARIIRNGIFTAIQFGIFTLSGVFFVPYLVRHYGSGSYGLIALAGFLTQYIGLISTSVGNSTARFLNIALNQNDWKQANEIFNTALVATVGFILLQLPFFALGIWKLHWIIDFPPELADEFRILVLCNVAGFFITLITGVFITPIQAANRVDISSSLAIAHLGLRILLLYTLIEVVGAQLWFVGVVDLGLILAHGLVVVSLRRRLAEGLAFGRKYITGTWIRPVLNMSGWALVTAMGACLFVKTDVWMINRFVSKELAGVYAALLVWPNFLRQISKHLATVLVPVYMIDYAKGDVDRVASLSFSSAKLLSCFIALIVGCLCVIAEPLLGIWLGDWAAEHVTLFRVMTVYLAFTIVESVLWQIFVAMDKVHFTGVITLVAGVINIAVSLGLIWAGFGAVGVAAGTAVASILAGSIAIPYGVCHVMGKPFKNILKIHLSAAAMLLISTVSTLVAVHVGHYSIVGAVLVLIVLVAAAGGLVARLILTSAEKVLIIRLKNRLVERARGFIARLRAGA